MRAGREGYRILTPSQVTVPQTAAASDVVQFNMPIAVVEDTERCVCLTVMRVGALEGRCSFSYATVEGSAQAGKQYVPKAGRIVMEPGEEFASLSVDVLDDGHWNATKEFQVALSDPEDCKLGMYLKVVRVKVVDTTTFPLDSFKEHLTEGREGIEKVGDFLLFAGILRHMSAQDGIWWRTIVTVCFDVLRNLYEYLVLVLSIYLVDTVFNFDDKDKDDLLIPGERLYTAYVVALLVFCPLLVFFLLDHIQVIMDIKGILHSHLSRSLFRKYMNYNSESRDTVPASDVLTAMIVDVGDAADGYLSAISVWRLIGKVAIQILFTLSKNPAAWWAVVFVPFVMAFWTAARTKLFIIASEAAGAKEVSRTEFVNEVSLKLPLIVSYKQRPQINDIFAQKMDALQCANRPLNRVILNNMSVPKLFGPALVALYSIFGASLVINGTLKLGVYLATIRVLSGVSNSFTDLFDLGMVIIGDFPAFRGLTVLLNKDTDVIDTRNVNKRRQKITMDRLEQMPLPSTKRVPRPDGLAIEVINCTYSSGIPKSPIFRNVNFSCAQGQIILVKAPANRGRRALLNVLADTSFPTAGVVFVPTHLRVLYVDRAITLMNLSVWQNLTFGNRIVRPNPYRVEKILGHFRMDRVCAMCKTELEERKREIAREENSHFDQLEEEHDNDEDEGNSRGLDPTEGAMKMFATFRESEQGLVHLARAFIMNPEVMVLHKPFAHFREDENLEELTAALAEQRDTRGFMMPLDGLLHRRPRTIFFTTNHGNGVEIVDYCWQLPNEIGGKCEQYAYI